MDRTVSHVLDLNFEKLRSPIATVQERRWGLGGMG